MHWGPGDGLWWLLEEFSGLIGNYLIGSSLQEEKIGKKNKIKNKPAKETELKHELTSTRKH